MLRAFPAACALLLHGCVTMTPLQTASPVAEGVTRLGGQLSASPWCGLALPSPRTCASFPNGFPLPEARLHARHGLGATFDVGLSLHGGAVVPVGSRLGALAEAKAELWSRPAGQGRHLLSVGPGVGFTHQQAGTFGGQRNTSEAALELALPLYYGYQTQALEWVVSPRFVERLYFQDLNRDGRRELLDYGSAGLATSVHSRGPVQFAVGLEYLAPTRYLAQGSFTLSAGVALDLGGSGASRPAAKERDLLDDR